MKELIINGVDVINCDYILNNSVKGKYHSPAKSMPYAKETSCIECKTNSTRYNFCKHNPDCYYKQWQRTQKQLDIAGKAIVEMVEKNDKLKAENKELAARLKEAEKFTGLYDTCGNKIYYGNIVHWTDGGDDLTLEERIKERWDRIAVVGKYMTDDNIIRPEICFNVIDSPSEVTKKAAPEFAYGCFIYKDTENYLTVVAENATEYKKKFKNAGECMAYVLEVRSEVGNKKL